MKKLIEDLIIQLDSRKNKDKKLIKESKESKEFVLLCAGKIIAFDFCIVELHRIIKFIDSENKI